MIGYCGVGLAGLDGRQVCNQFPNRRKGRVSGIRSVSRRWNLNRAESAPEQNCSSSALGHSVVIYHDDSAVEKIFQLSEESDEIGKQVLFGRPGHRDILDEYVLRQIGFDKSVKFAQ